MAHQHCQNKSHADLKGNFSFRLPAHWNTDQMQVHLLSYAAGGKNGIYAGGKIAKNNIITVLFCWYVAHSSHSYLLPTVYVLSLTIASELND